MKMRLTIILIFFAFSCRPNAEPAKDDIHYETKTIAFTKDDESSPLGFWETNVEYPLLLEVNPAHKKVNEAITKIAEEFTCDNGKGDKEFLAEITLLNADIMSLKYSDSWYCEGMANTQGRTGSAIFNLANGNEIKVDNELSEDRSKLEIRIRDDFIQSIKNKGVDCPEPRPAFSYLAKNEMVFVNYSDDEDSVQCEVEARIPSTEFRKFVKTGSELSKLTN
jgi:hypothetical protein